MTDSTSVDAPRHGKRRRPNFFKKNNAILARSSEIGYRETIVLLIFLSHGNSDDISWPSALLISEMVQCSERTVKRIIKSLKERGWLENVGRFGGRGIVAKRRVCIPPEPVAPIIAMKPEPRRHMEVNP